MSSTIPESSPAQTRPPEFRRILVQEIAAVAFIVALVAIAFASVVFSGKSLVVPENAHPYRPPGLTAGLLLSAAGSTAMVLCLLVPRRRPRHEPAR